MLLIYNGFLPLSGQKYLYKLTELNYNTLAPAAEYMSLQVSATATKFARLFCM